MANQDAAFGLRPIGKVGSNRDAGGLTEYEIAACASAIYQNDCVKASGAGIAIAAATDNGKLLGSLQGIFYTDASTNKPTFANNLVDVINKSIILDLTGIYNYGTNNYISRYDFALYIAEYFNYDSSLINPIKTNQLKQNAKRPLKTGLICDNIISALDIELETIPFILNKHPN